MNAYEEILDEYDTCKTWSDYNKVEKKARDFLDYNETCEENIKKKSDDISSFLYELQEDKYAKNLFETYGKVAAKFYLSFESFYYGLMAKGIIDGGDFIRILPNYFCIQAKIPAEEIKILLRILVKEDLIIEGYKKNYYALKHIITI